MFHLIRQTMIVVLLSYLKIFPSWLELKNTPNASLERGKTQLPRVSCIWHTKQSDSEVLVMLELWGMQSTPLLPSVQGPLKPGVIAPDKGPIFGSKWTKPWFWKCFVFVFKMRIYAKLNCLWHLDWVPMLKWIIWNKTFFLHLTLCIAKSAEAEEYTDCTSVEW